MDRINRKETPNMPLTEAHWIVLSTSSLPPWHCTVTCKEGDKTRQDDCGSVLDNKCECHQVSFPKNTSG